MTATFSDAVSPADRRMRLSVSARTVAPVCVTTEPRRAIGDAPDDLEAGAVKTDVDLGAPS
jgi:hypothetical protein